MTFRNFRRIAWWSLVIAIGCGQLETSASAQNRRQITAPAAPLERYGPVEDLQWSLVWTGHYNGLVDGKAGPGTRSALERWQADRAAAQLSADATTRKLKLEADAVRGRLGWRIIEHPKYPIRYGVPEALVTMTSGSADGDAVLFQSRDAQTHYRLALDRLLTQRPLRERYEQLRSVAGKDAITYSMVNDTRYVVSGRSGPTQFYIAARALNDQVVAIALYSDSLPDDAFSILAVASINALAFVDRPPPRPVASSGTQSAPEPRRRLSDERLDFSLSPQTVYRTVRRSIYTVESEATTPSARCSRQGSGVAVAGNRIATNCHVLCADGTTSVANAGRSDRVIAISQHATADLCLLEVARSDHTPIRFFGRASSLEVGDAVLTIGSPRGLTDSLSTGVVSQLRMWSGVPVVQTTASISPGSSGGALVDSLGRLIGITTAMLRESQNLNIAIAADALSDLLPATFVDRRTIAIYAKAEQQAPITDAVYARDGVSGVVAWLRDCYDRSPFKTDLAICAGIEKAWKEIDLAVMESLGRRTHAADYFSSFEKRLSDHKTDVSFRFPGSEQQWLSEVDVAHAGFSKGLADALRLQR